MGKRKKAGNFYFPARRLLCRHNKHNDCYDNFRIHQHDYCNQGCFFFSFHSTFFPLFPFRTAFSNARRNSTSSWMLRLTSAKLWRRKFLLSIFTPHFSQVRTTCQSWEGVIRRTSAKASKRASALKISAASVGSSYFLRHLLYVVNASRTDSAARVITEMSIL